MIRDDVGNSTILRKDGDGFEMWVRELGSRADIEFYASFCSDPIKVKVSKDDLDDIISVLTEARARIVEHTLTKETSEVGPDMESTVIGIKNIELSLNGMGVEIWIDNGSVNYAGQTLRPSEVDELVSALLLLKNSYEQSRT